MKQSKGARVTARLHESTKHKLAKSGYNAAEAIEWFVTEYYSKRPRRQLEIRQDLEEIELNRLKKIECEIQLEIEHKEKLIEKLVSEKSKYPEVKRDITEIITVDDDQVEDSGLSDNELEAVERVRTVWDEKRDYLVGAYDDEREVFDTFIVMQGDFINNVHKDCCSKMKFKDFKELLLREVVGEVN